MVWLDLETFSLEPIASGVYKYAEQSRILLCAYAIDDAPARVVDVARSEPWPAELVAKLRDPFCVLVAHNSNFGKSRPTYLNKCPIRQNTCWTNK